LPLVSDKYQQFTEKILFINKFVFKKTTNFVALTPQNQDAFLTFSETPIVKDTTLKYNCASIDENNLSALGELTLSCT